MPQVATAEHFVATRVGQRPSTAINASSDPIESLKKVVNDAQNTSAEEAFQGRTCLTWAVSAGLAQRQEDAFNAADIVALFDRYGSKGTSAWTKICLLKLVYLQARSYSMNGEEQKALLLYRTATAWVELNITLVKSIPQLSYWAEQSLAECATIPSEHVTTSDRLNAFKVWSSLTSKSQETSSSIYGNPVAHVSRSNVWKTYYEALSRSIAQSQYETSPSISRSQQASELRAAEAAYETVFLRNRKFPKATESNAPVEEWVEQVIKNWNVLCSPNWLESDLGEGGRNAVTRNVLDVLYRAATKTFHSTLILRRLFEVHKSLTEFDLAYKCLDTYIELTERAKERSAKSQEQDPNQDSNEILLLTVSEGVEGLCAFGRQQDAQKARDLAEKMEDWLDQIFPESNENTIPNGHVEPVHQVDTHSSEPPSSEALQRIYRAIGIAKAHWAKWTPFNENRSDLQSEALTALQKACSLADPQLSTLYALAMLNAEMRDIPQAIRATKVALEQITRSNASNAIADQQKTAFWHLMTLLLTSQQDFETALQTSNATLDSVLASVLPESRLQNKLQNGSTEKHDERFGAAVTRDMSCENLQMIAELQISYIALVELIDGPEAALNHGNDLLSLFSMLFSRFGVGEDKVTTEQNLVPPKTAASTIKSTKGSMFSRKRDTASSIAQSATMTSINSTSPNAKISKTTTQTSQPPAIQVTDETGKSPIRKHNLPHHLPHHRHHHQREAETAKAPNRLSKTSRPGTSTGAVEGHSNVLRVDEASKAELDRDKDLNKAIAPTGQQHDASSEAKQPIGEIPHNVDSHDSMPPPPGHKDQPPQQDVRLPTVHPYTTSTSPAPRFPKAATQRHALSILNKIWLITSALYRRSHMFEDAKEANEEAHKAATRIETLVSASDTSARALAEPGWGGVRKSVDEIWADVYCSKAELLLAIAKRREEEGQPLTSDSLREVVDQYEQCLMYFPNHASGIVGLSNILLDYYEKKVDLAKKVDDGRSYVHSSSISTFGASMSYNDAHTPDTLTAFTPGDELSTYPFASNSAYSDASNEDLRKTPENLNRIASRDRAYGLLSILTKLGTGWDNSEAWFALARAHELGGEIDKSKQILWWVIELENSRPIRHWRNLGCTGYVL